MSDVRYDVDQTINIINKNGNVDNYHDKVYFCSNENISTILDVFDVRDKNVLSVLASSDQMFQLYSHGARQVDLFDINKLTIYYYYLRKWSLQYLNRVSPPKGFDKNYIYELLKCASIKSPREKDAFDYWIKVLKFDNISKIFRRFFMPYKNALSNIELVKSKLNNNFNFYNIDISSDCSQINKKYDVIYVSNIGDWITHKEDMIRYRDNLLRLLKRDGIVISSLLSPEHDINYLEEDILTEKFLLSNEMSYGYSYVKR